jgi:hypothetical protein
VKKRLALSLLAAVAVFSACGSHKPPERVHPEMGHDAPPRPPTQTHGGTLSDDPPMGNDAPPPPPPDADSRKHAFARLANNMWWSGAKASMGEDVYFQRVVPGMSFDVTEGPAIVVQGKVTNEKNQELAYWNQKPHRIQCTKDGECIVFVHANAKADARELFAPDIKWAQLDPSRPDPLVSPLWGDGTAGPHGFLMKMKAGGGPFWHIHKYDYQGVVLVGNVVSYESGRLPDSAGMPPGSYWWQPGGNKHVDLCKAGGPDCVVYVYFEGPFDVVPAE